MLRRRELLLGAAALPLSLLWRRRAHAARLGPLVPDPDGILDLPEGFTYRVVSRIGDPMDDGYLTPGMPDGMACFAGDDGTFVLLRNHELSAGQTAWSAWRNAAPPAEAFDPRELGGVTRVVVDRSGAPVSSNLVLAGTTRNCAGGKSPWGWLSCEETTLAGHGYVFVCPSDAARVATPVRVPGYGRFNHVAATAGADGVAYLTEDNGAGCFYRFVPHDPASPWQGRLQALRVRGVVRADLGAGGTVGSSWEIEWVDVADPEASVTPTRAQAQALGAAVVRRGEGLWLDDGGVYFTATTGGPRGLGQVFHLAPDGDGGVLTLLAQSEDPEVLEYPDNLTMAPWGDLFVCEDGGGRDRIQMLHRDGSVSPFAQNAHSESELAGVCLSPDGSLLFVNLQGDGLTLAIRGPFPSGSGGGDDAGVTGEPAVDLSDAHAGGSGCAADGGAGAGVAAVAAIGAAALATSRRSRAP